MLWAKVPSYEWKLEKHSLKLAFKEHYGELPDAYEQVFLDAIRSKHDLFTTSEEVLESWRIVTPLLQHWEMQDGSDLRIYKTGDTIEKIVAS